MSTSPDSLLGKVQQEISRAVIGQADWVEQLFLCVTCGGHCQIEGPAGVAKWLAVESLASCLGLVAAKLRGSADLWPELILPNDPSRAADFSLLQANLLFVDNLNQLPPRSYNLIQQAMQEQAIESAANRFVLPRPFSVLAAQHVPEDAGEPQLDHNADRFLFRVRVPYPQYWDEYAMAETLASRPTSAVQQVMTREQFLATCERVTEVAAPPPVVHYAVRLVRATRVHEGENPDFVYEWVQRGAGPRAAHAMVLAAKARAVLSGRTEASVGDVRSVAFPALRHRILTNRNAWSNGISPDRVIARLLDEIPPRVSGDDVPPRSGQALTFHDWIPVDEQM